MGTIADKLAYTNEAKEGSKAAIIAKGVAVPDTAPFGTYKDYIFQISGGGQGGAVDVVQASSPISLNTVQAQQLEEGFYETITTADIIVEEDE